MRNRVNRAQKTQATIEIKAAQVKLDREKQARDHDQLNFESYQRVLALREEYWTTMVKNVKGGNK